MNLLRCIANLCFENLISRKTHTKKYIAILFSSFQVLPSIQVSKWVKFFNISRFCILYSTQLHFCLTFLMHNADG